MSLRLGNRRSVLARARGVRLASEVLRLVDDGTVLTMTADATVAVKSVPQAIMDR